MNDHTQDDANAMITITKEEFTALNDTIADLTRKVGEKVTGNLLRRNKLIRVSSSIIECPICCCSNIDQPRYRLPCAHVFHETCVAKWFTHQHPAAASCPSCRARL